VTAETTERAGQARPPFLLVHGTADWMVPYAQSEQLNVHLSVDHLAKALLP
jgi:dipeptidyl aminopeptidase/acylaminoacyl peptidase